MDCVLKNWLISWPSSELLLVLRYMVPDLSGTRKLDRIGSCSILYLYITCTCIALAGMTELLLLLLLKVTYC